MHSRCLFYTVGLALVVIISPFLLSNNCVYSDDLINSAAIQEIKKTCAQSFHKEFIAERVYCKLLYFNVK